MSDVTYKGTVVDAHSDAVSGATVTASNANTSVIVGSTTTKVPNESINFSASKEGESGLSFSDLTSESPDGPDTYSYTWS